MFLGRLKIWLYLIWKFNNPTNPLTLSDASGISLNSSSVNITGTPPPTGKKNLTALILETVEEHGFKVHYLVPNQLSKKLARLRRKGVKLHVSNEHLFVAKHIKRYVYCLLGYSLVFCNQNGKKPTVLLVFQN